MNKCLVSVLLLLLLAPAALHAAGCSATAGGAAVVIPAPTAEFAEVGSDKQDVFDYLVPSRNRLLCAFVPADLLPSLKKPAIGLNRYMVVEVSRKLDVANTEVTPADFEEVVASIKKRIGDSDELNRTTQSAADEISGKLKAIDQSKDVALGQPSPLGTLFQTQDAYAFAMLAPISSGGVTVKTINASVLLRARHRLLFAYIYASGEDETSLKWVEKTAEDWSHEIIDANPNK